MMETLQKLFIRPSRHLYASKDLGSARLTVCGRQVHRLDTTLQNKRHQKIEVSCFLFDKIEKTEEIIIYLHCNSGSRVEGIAHARQILEAGYPFLVFDFCGSGLSDGEYVTLGVNESEDLQTIVKYLKDINKNIKLVLWGRSMGAVASLLFLQSHSEDISVAVFDSPFFNLRSLALHIGNHQTSLPKFMLQGFIGLLNGYLKDKTRHDLFSRLSLEKLVDKISTPGLFVGSKKDSLIPFSHIESLYNQFGGYKQIYYLDQDHHEKRSCETVSFILNFISKHLTSIKIHKKTTSNISGMHLSKAKNSSSQLDFRISLESCKKIDLITKSARKKENTSIKPFNRHRQADKRRFIHLIQKNGSTQLHDDRTYATQDFKLLRNDTEIFRQTWKREPIRLCKRKKDRTPLKEISQN